MFKNRLHGVVTHFILLAGIIFLITPIVLIFVSSTHQSSLLGDSGLQLWPGSEGVKNFTRVLTLQAGFTDQITALDMMKNSLIIASGVAFLTTIVSLCAAYGMVYFKLRIANFVFWLTLATLLLPLESRFITTFLVTDALGLINTHVGMILPVLSVALGTLFFRQLFLSIPSEYLEAAKLDGAGPVRFFVDFIVPMSWKRGGAIFIVTFMIGWNQYLWPLMISTDESRYTLVRGIRLVGEGSGTGMALIVLSILPPLILVIIFQRWFFKALADEKNAF
ncbi:MAG: carbohydrate ABC transporter permease [Rhodobacterales bacterium]